MTDDEERKLLTHYRPWLRGVARRMAPHRDIDDLAAEGWIAMWRALHTPARTDRPAPVDWWLKHIATQRMTMCLRDWHEPMKQRQHAYTDDVAAVVDLPHELGALELAYHHGEIHAALDSLSPREREYVIARFWTGMGPPQLQKHFGYKPDGLWRTARPKLAGVLAHLDDTDRLPIDLAVAV